MLEKEIEAVLQNRRRQQAINRVNANIALSVEWLHPEKNNKYNHVWDEIDNDNVKRDDEKKLNDLYSTICCNDWSDYY